MLDFALKNTHQTHCLAQAITQRRAVVFTAIATFGNAFLPLRTACAQAKESALPTPSSFPQAAHEASQKGEPLLVLVSLPGCPWCELLRRNYLAPMRADGVQAVQFTVNDKTQRFEGFSASSAASQNMTGVDMSVAYKARVTPTLLFLDAKGLEIAERITGVASVDFIGAQIEQRLTLARLALKGANK